jgi:hypothetical protein
LPELPSKKSDLPFYGELVESTSCQDFSWRFAFLQDVGYANDIVIDKPRCLAPTPVVGVIARPQAEAISFINREEL